MYEAGKTEENQNTKGMALLMNKNFTDYVEKIKMHRTLWNRQQK